VGRLVPKPAEEGVHSEASEWELREGGEREEERRQKAKAGRRGGTTAVPPHALLQGPCGRGVEAGGWFLFLVFPLLFSLVRFISLRVRPGGGQWGAATRVGQWTGTEKCVHRHDLDRSYVIND
jgi:hypothetical protein